MNRSEKIQFTALSKNNEFNLIIEKLTINNSLTEKEQSFILTVALMLLKFYTDDNRLRGYREFAYYIILKYSIIYQDYQPLYDYAINMGLYPVASLIIKEFDNSSVAISITSELSNIWSRVLYSDKENNVLTGEQKHLEENIINYITDNDTDVAYVAPTSYGKSKLITSIIEHKKSSKIGIIVPSKSLLTQTYKLIKEANLPYKILLHDEMYDSEDKFIAIFTQERALRFFDKYQKFFDLLFIDEAHHLLEKDQRSILLTRVLKLNKINKPNAQNIYLTPLIDNINNISLSNTTIYEQKIRYSMKEPEYIEYLRDGSSRVYNRFLGNFYSLTDISYTSHFEYIIKNAEKKNFIFIVSPRKIEIFAKEIVINLPNIQNDDVKILVDLLSEYIHPKFQMIEMIKKGCIYLHGKLPDEIKEYIEYKFKNLDFLKYIVANTVILEGINLPIDNLYIMSRRYQSKQSFINLIGRINRLNIIFGQTGSIAMLLPKVHFINLDYYDMKNGLMSNMIENFRSSSFEDKIENPMLKNKSELNEAEIRILELEKIATDTNDRSLKSRLIHHNINTFYGEFDSKIEKIQQNIDTMQQPNTIDPINLIYYIFIQNVIDPNIDLNNSDINIGNYSVKNDFEFLRLENQKARNYYINYFLHSRHYPFSERVLNQVRYFKDQIKKNDSEFYIGKGYGEIPRSSLNYPSNLRVYVDLRNKTEEELVNLAVIKLKIEQDFISYKLSRFITFMHEYSLITKEQYNFLMYGVDGDEDIRYIKAGLNINLLHKLKTDNQLKNVLFDEYNNLERTPVLTKYIQTLSDYDQYHLNKLIV